MQEIQQLVNSGYDYVKQDLRDETGTYASDGSLEFWSSGGLIQSVQGDEPALTYESYDVVPKHIQVISLAENVAMAQFYVEGSYQETGPSPC